MSHETGATREYAGHSVSLLWQSKHACLANGSLNREQMACRVRRPDLRSGVECAARDRPTARRIPPGAGVFQQVLPRHTGSYQTKGVVKRLVRSESYTGIRG